MLILIIAVSVVLIVSFLCSIFESVLLSLPRSQVELLAQRHRRAGRMLTRFKENIDVPIAAILILNTAAHTVGAAVAGASYSNVFDPSSLWLFTILFTIAVLLFTEIVPKTVGVTHARRLAVPVAYGISWLTLLLRPLVALSERISRSLRGNVKIPVTTAEEIRLLATLGRSKGVVGVDTAGIIVGATHLRHLQVHDVMLPREDVKFFSGEMDRAQAIRLMRRTGHSRFPFSPTRELRDVTGVVLAKDLLYWLLQNADQQVDWDALQREPLMIPSNAPILQVLRTFQNSRRHLAIVIDEYGSVEGLVTLEDVLEEIVGDIFDESDLPRADFQELEDGTLIVRARVDLRKLCARLEIPWDPDIEPSTIGGLVTEMLERIPVKGDEIAWNGYKVEVLRADARRATLLSIRGP